MFFNHKYEHNHTASNASRKSVKLNKQNHQTRRMFLEPLESRELLSATPITNPDIERDSGIFATQSMSTENSSTLECDITTLQTEGQANNSLFNVSNTKLQALNASSTFSLHSSSNSSKVIYLDFDGHSTSNTSWNTLKGISTIVTPAYSIDGDSSFSEKELENIYDIWAYTAEYFSSFDVDVTTDESAYSISNGIRVVIGGNCTDWYYSPGGASGVGYNNSFTWNSDTPVFVFSESSFDSPSSVAGTIAHEVGHSLGLSHDSTSTQEYYSGSNGWSPIMGGGNGPVFQWSKGEYAGATNREDDLNIITTQNGFGYRTDDYGNTISTAQPIQVSSNQFTINGIIEQNTDSDYFKVVLTESSDLYVTVSPDKYNCSLDTKLQLLNSSGNIIASSAPTDSLSAKISYNNLDIGTYYLVVTNDGCDTAYSNYGSIGSYVFSGTVGNSTQTTVTTNKDIVNADDGVISLREAIANAKAGDRIVFSKSAFKAGDTIELSSELIINKGVTIDASAFYDEDTQTPGITLSGADSHRIFNISGGTTSTPVELIGLTITNGMSDSTGGAILVDGNLTVKQCLFQNNKSKNSTSGTYGGAIGSTAYRTTITAIQCKFINNEADFGGALAIRNSMSTIRLDSCILVGNHAGSWGGAICALYTCSQIDVLNTVIAGNKGNSSGAIYNYGTCNIKNSTIAGNVSTTGTGGLYLTYEGNTQTIENSIIAQNYTGEQESDMLISGNAKISYSLIGNASGLTEGTGCIFGTSDSPANPYFTKFTSVSYQDWTNDSWKNLDLMPNPKSAAINAGSNEKAMEAFNGNLSEQKDCSGTNSRLNEAVIDMGAYEYTDKCRGINFSTTSPYVSESLTVIPTPDYANLNYQWYYSSTRNGEYTLIEGATSDSFTLSEFYANKYIKCVATENDGNTWSIVTENAVQKSDRANLSQATEIIVTSNLDVVNEYDGIITLREAIKYATEYEIFSIEFADSMSNATIQLTQGELQVIQPVIIDAKDLNVTINTATTGRLFNISGGTDYYPVILVGLNLTGGNVTDDVGGAILASDTLFLQNCNIYDNKALYGGAIAAGSSGTHIYVSNSVISGNEAQYGGAIELGNTLCRLYFISSIAAGNVATNTGGVFHSGLTCARIVIFNSALIGNYAYEEGGAGVNYGRVYVYASTIAGNVSQIGVGGITFGMVSDNVIENSIIAQNKGGDSTLDDIDIFSTVTVDYSLIGNGNVNNLYIGSGNLIGSANSPTNPGFVSLTPVTANSWTKDTWKTWDYSLKSDSIAVNAGSNDLAYIEFGVENNTELAIQKDILGKSRLSDSVIDMGACEYSFAIALDKPSLNVPSTNGTTVTASWNSIPNTSTYQLEYKLSDSSKWTTQTVTGTSTTFEGTEGLTYNIRVKAIGSGNYLDSEYSDTQVVTIPITLTGVTLSTNSPIVGETITASVSPSLATCSYQWYRGNTPISGATKSVYNVTEADFGNTLKCTVTGYGNYMGSVSSQATNIVMQHLNSPTNLIATYDKTNSSIALTWAENSNASSYTVLYSTSSDFSTYTKTQSGTNSVTISGIFADNTSYFFKVMAVGNAEQHYLDSEYSKLCAVKIGNGIAINDVFGIVKYSNVTNAIFNDLSTMTKSAKSVITDWDPFYVELWTEESLQIQAGKTFTTSITYNPNQFQPDMEQTVVAPNGIVGTLSKPQVQPDGLMTVTVDFAIDANIDIITNKNTYWGSVLFMPNTTDGAGVTDELNSETLDVTVAGTKSSTTVKAMPYDLDSNDSSKNKIDSSDFIAFAKVYGINTSTLSPDNKENQIAIKADFNNDGKINAEDFLLFAINYGLKKGDGKNVVLDDKSEKVQEKCTVSNVQCANNVQCAVSNEPFDANRLSSECESTSTPHTSLLTPNLIPTHHSSLLTPNDSTPLATSVALLDLYDNQNRNSSDSVSPSVQKAVTAMAIDEVLTAEDSLFYDLLEDSDSESEESEAVDDLLLEHGCLARL